MKFPFPAEHDQQQAEALDDLRKAEAFILVLFADGEEECDHPFCAIAHNHRSTKIIASCGAQDLRHAVHAIGEEIALTSSIELLMNLGEAQREQIAAMLRHEPGTFFKLRDGDEE